VPAFLFAAAQIEDAPHGQVLAAYVLGVLLVDGAVALDGAFDLEPL
jgi:hypothetical protein